MTDLTKSEVIEVGDLDADRWNDYAEAQGWSDGMPLMVPTEDKVAAFVETCRAIMSRSIRCRHDGSCQLCRTLLPTL